MLILGGKEPTKMIILLMYIIIPTNFMGVGAGVAYKLESSELFSGVLNIILVMLSTFFSGFFMYPNSSSLQLHLNIYCQ